MLDKQNNLYNIRACNPKFPIEGADLESFSIVGIHEHLIIAIKTIQSLTQAVDALKLQIDQHDNTASSIKSILDVHVAAIYDTINKLEVPAAVTQVIQTGDVKMSDLDEVKQALINLEARLKSVEASIESRILAVEVKVETAIKGELVKVEQSIVKIVSPLEVQIRALIVSAKSKIQQFLLKLVDKLK